MTAAEALGQNAVIRAPFNGTVTQRLHNPGDLVRAADRRPDRSPDRPQAGSSHRHRARADLDRFAVGATARAVAAPSQAQGATRPVERRRKSRCRVAESRFAPSAGSWGDFDGRCHAWRSIRRRSFAPGHASGPRDRRVNSVSNVPLVPAIAVLQGRRQQSRGRRIAAGSIAQRRPVVTGRHRRPTCRNPLGPQGGRTDRHAGPFRRFATARRSGHRPRRRPRNCGL